MWHRFWSAVTMVTKQSAASTGSGKKTQYFDTFQSGALRANKEILTFCKTIWQDNKALLMYPRSQCYWISCLRRHVLFHSGEPNVTGKWKAAFCGVAARGGLQPTKCIPLLFIFEISRSVTTELTRPRQEIQSGSQWNVSFLFPLEMFEQVPHRKAHLCC